ncbi:MAG: heme-binding protein [Saprospiraceae bacterium]|nr:heme-binding protein [Saprospiraceae bacterium]
MATSNTEEQKYTTIKTFDEFEIRFYPEVVMASVTMESKTYKEVSGSGFRKLAGYIFGGNQASKQISMTSPVHMDISQNKSTMSFVMPSQYDKSTLPLPNDSNIIIHKSAPEVVAAIRFGGFASDEDISFHTEKLKKLLFDNKIKAIGKYKYLGYNPPYQVTNRRNEIIVEIEWEKV